MRPSARSALTIRGTSAGTDDAQMMAELRQCAYLDLAGNAKMDWVKNATKHTRAASHDGHYSRQRIVKNSGIQFPYSVRVSVIELRLFGGFEARVSSTSAL